ncbi:cytochrome P450 [Paraburkholderia sp. MMS20-SJTR3]|uniref:Cytochrome P450 n=1 Tax=Paraburkholderia sejongensis TaxID=2886946 RepID=A0ABS8JZV9_9BURK|nr:cytochrome P450 [Paraburkholderia sp. MMS20-SJTR3]MCC8395437.1 cytochrome P450 [Paraburkholderia sp. MMS20-SJTR3]
MKTRRIAPGPSGRLMGNLAEYKRDPVTMLLKLQQQYGDIARNRLGPFLTHALAHPEHVQYVLQENHRNYVRGRFYEDFKLFFGDGLLTTDGEFWRRHRRAVQPLFHRKQVNEHVAAVGAAALGLVQRWSEVPAGEPLEVVEEMMHLSLSMLGLMVFNTDISRFSRQVGPSVRFGIAAMLRQGDLNDFIPRWLPTPFNRRIAEARRNIDGIIGQIIEDHRTGTCDPSDVISLLLNARHPDTGEPMTPREVHDEVMTVFLAGHETTGTGIAWALYALAQNPGVLRQLREELDARLGGRAPTLEDLDALPYLDQVVNEVLRMYPPIWGFTRDLIDDDEIGGFHIPAGSSVFMSPYVTHRHPAFWRNPDAFDPENFASHAPTPHRFGYFPFGGGMRKCIGFQTALLQMRVLTAVVAQHVDLSMVPGHPIERGPVISLRPLQGIRMVVTPRRRDTARAAGGQGGAGVKGEREQVAAVVAKVAAAQAARTQQAPSGMSEPSAAGGGCPFAAPVATAQLTVVPQPVPSAAAEVKPAAAGPMPVAQIAQVAPVTPLTPVAASAATAPTTSPPTTPAFRFTWFASEIDPVPATPAPELGGKRVVMVNGRPGTVERVAVALARASAVVSVFAPGDADPTEAARALVRDAGPFDCIVDLGLEGGFSFASAAAWEAPMRDSVAMLQACYPDWEVEQDASRLFYLALTWMDGLMGYADSAAEPLVQPLGGLWAGLAKTLPQEIPNCNVRVLDLAPADAARCDRLIARELYRCGLFEVGYRAGRRYTLRARRHELPAHSTDPAGELEAGDTVLFSGGARGIGLLCATALAERHGCTVIVTGREPLPDGTEAWLNLDEAGFQRYGVEQLKLATRERTPKSIREQLARLRRRRELKHSLDALAARGLPVHYRVCDVSDAAAVRALCDEWRDTLRVVIHNAGVDRPVRLPLKSADAFIDTARTKVAGFANLCAAVAGFPRLAQFCNVGSLTGRWGGMTGETDYAAANDALARLGLWAHRHALACSVKTLVWPTWENVGMITNFAVTKRYITPLAADEGVRHWLRELADRGSGEVMFMGAVGPALTPVQLKGFAPIFELPNIAELITRLHHAGEPLRFQPFTSFATRYRIDPGAAPVARAFRVAGRHALPAALLLEHACSVAGWVMPATLEPHYLEALTDVVVRLEPLPLDHEAAGRAEKQADKYANKQAEKQAEKHANKHAEKPASKRPDQHTEKQTDPASAAQIVLQTEANGYLRDERWHVDVRCTLAGTRTELLSATLVYRTGAVPEASRGEWPARASLGAASLPAQSPLTWNAHVLPAADWQAPHDSASAIARVGRVACADASDLWAVPLPPELRLPVNHIENVLRALAADQAHEASAAHATRDPAPPPRAWRIGSITCGALPAASAAAIVQCRDGHVDIVDGLGRHLLELRDMTLRTSAA